MRLMREHTDLPLRDMVFGSQPTITHVMSTRCLLKQIYSKISEKLRLTKPVCMPVRSRAFGSKAVWIVVLLALRFVTPAHAQLDMLATYGQFNPGYYTQWASLYSGSGYVFQGEVNRQSSGYVWGVSDSSANDEIGVGWSSSSGTTINPSKLTYKLVNNPTNGGSAQYFGVSGLSQSDWLGLFYFPIDVQAYGLKTGDQVTLVVDYLKVDSTSSPYAQFSVGVFDGSGSILTKTIGANDGSASFSCTLRADVQDVQVHFVIVTPSQAGMTVGGVHLYGTPAGQTQYLTKPVSNIRTIKTFRYLLDLASADLYTVPLNYDYAIFGEESYTYVPLLKSPEPADNTHPVYTAHGDYR